MTRKIYDTGTLTTANGIASHVTTVPIVGTVEKVEIKGTSFTNGSLTFTTSGATYTGEVLATLTAISGAVTVTRYPFVYGFNDATALSGATYSQMNKLNCFDHLVIATVGCGSAAAGTTGTVRIHYYGD